MGVKELYYCDRCDKQWIDPVKLKIPNSKSPKAGFKDNVSHDDCTDEVHLCNGCAQEKVQQWIDDYAVDFENVKELKRWVGEEN